MTIASSIRLANKLNYDLGIVWKPHPHWSCKYNAIFGDNIKCITDSPALLEYPVGNSPRLCINLDEIKGNDLYIRYFHFIFSLEDLNTPPIQITNELKESWNEITPSNQVLEKYDKSTYNLGIHIRRAVDIETASTWDKPSDSFISNLTKNFIIKQNIKSIYLCSPSQVTTNFLRDDLSSLDVSITTSTADVWDLHDDSSIVQAYVDILNLASCKHIVRHFLSTFSAIPSLISAETEVVYTDDEQTYERVPLVFSGAAL
jgi:hypothetical protein